MKINYIYIYAEGHELGSFGIINMNGRIYDPNTASFFSPDPYVSSPYSTQAFNRYSYCVNNPLMYTDPSGEFIFTLLAAIFCPPLLPVAIGADIGMWCGGSMANGTMNPFKWDYSSGKTWGYMLGGAVTGAASGYVGGLIASSGIPMANTAAVASSSLLNSVGTNIYTGGQTDITMSLGFCSFNFTTGKFSTFSSKNKWYENVGYGLGSLANVSDMLTYADRFMKIEDKIADEANTIADYYKSQGHTQDKALGMGKNLNGTSYMGPWNPLLENGDYYFGRVKNWGYKEYAAYLHDVDYTNLGLNKGASALFNSLSPSVFVADVTLMARQMFLSLKHFDIGGILFGAGMTGISVYKGAGIIGYTIGRGVRIMPR